MEKAISTITNFVASKEGITKFVNQCVNEIEAGLIDPLHMTIYLKTMEKIVEGIQSKIKEAALNETGKYVEQSFEYRGAQIDKVELGVKYDFTNCNDKEWNELDMNIKELSEKKKIVEGFLKSLKEPINLFNENTGETWTVSPPIKTSTSGIKVTIR